MPVNAPHSPTLDPTLKQFASCAYLVATLRCSRQAIHQKRERGTMFPRPVAQMDDGRFLWSRDEVDFAAKLFPPH